MDTSEKVIIGISIYTIGSYLYTRNVKLRALARARFLSHDKGIVNLGAGYNHNGLARIICELPEVVTNVDAVNEGVKLVQANLDTDVLPFSNNQFDIAFASHVLEHLVNWQAALSEWNRISDHVIIVLPAIFTVGNWTEIDHKNHFLKKDVDYIKANWPKTEVYM